MQGLPLLRKNAAAAQSALVHPFNSGQGSGGSAAALVKTRSSALPLYTDRQVVVGCGSKMLIYCVL